MLLAQASPSPSAPIRAPWTLSPTHRGPPRTFPSIIGKASTSFACRGCRLVGIELLDEAVELPAFPHPVQAAYVLGPERGVLSAGVIARCHHLVRIPTAFSLNVATAGTIVMYDRLRSLGRFASRPVAGGSLPEPVAEHVQGGPRRRRRRI